MELEGGGVPLVVGLFIREDEGWGGGCGEGIGRVIGIASAAWDGVANAGVEVVEGMRANVPLHRL